MTDVTRWLIKSNRLFNAETTVMYPDVINSMPDPYDPALWPNNDARTSVTNISTPNPTGVDIVGRVEQIGASADGLIESVPTAAIIGEKFYTCIVAKHIDTPINELRIRISDGVGFLQSNVLNLDTGVEVGASSIVSRVTDIGNDYRIFECEWTVTRNTAAIQSQIFMWNDANGGVPLIGSKMNIQAAFFGKADDFPALVQPVQVC
jgi:hypothetical protein